jgi:uncharacterized protein YjiK
MKNAYFSTLNGKMIALALMFFAFFGFASAPFRLNVSSLFSPKIAHADVWWNASWLKRVKINFTNSSRGALTNFPVQVVLNSARITYGDFLAGGNDVRFVDADGSTVLNYEIEKWNTSATSSMWVKIPQIDSGSNTDYIYMYYGNSGATATATTTGVWDSNYVSVLHMNASTTAAAPNELDSTVNAKHATSSGLTATTTTILGDGLDLNGTSQLVYFGSSTLPIPISAGTVEMWFNPDTFATDTNGRYLVTRDKSGNNDGEWRLFLDDTQSSKLVFRIECGTAGTSAFNVISSSAPATTSGWFYTAAVWNASGGSNNMNLYVNGNATGTPASPTCGMNVQAEQTEIGRNNGKAPLGGYFDGQIDEFRISNTARSSDWQNASYASGLDTLNTYGSVEPQGDITAPVISSIVATPGTTTASVTWSTNEAASSSVSYGLTTSYGTVASSSATSTHSVSLSGLSPSTQYHYRVLAMDPTGNISTSTDATFTTSAAPDTTAPNISSVASSTTFTTATITWSTNEAASSTLNYGLTTGYGTASTSVGTTSHSIVITGLATSTAYHFQIVATDSSSNASTSQDYTFTTATPTAPGQPTGLTAYPYETRAYLRWTASSGTVTDYKIEYKLSTDSSWSTFSHAVSTATTTMVTSLTNNLAYNFRVTGINSGTEGTVSSQATTTPATLMAFVSPTITNGVSTSSSSITGYASTTLSSALTPSTFSFRLETSGGTFVAAAATTTRYGDYSLAHMTQIQAKTADAAFTTTDLSGQVYVPTTDTLFTVHNGKDIITEVTRAGAFVRVITCSGCGDIEDITLVSSVASSSVGGFDHTFMISTEDGYDGVTLDPNSFSSLQIFPVVIHSTGAATVNRSRYYSTGIAAALRNDGLEGVAYNSNTDTYFTSVEGQATQSTEPKIYEVTLQSGHSATSTRICVTSGGVSAPNFRNYLTEDNTAAYGNTTYADISGLDYVPSIDRLYAISHKGDEVIEIDVSNRASCTVLNELEIGMRADSGSNHDFEMPEGIAWDSTGDYMYISAESNYWSYWRTNAYAVRNTFSGLADGTYNIYASVTDSFGNTSTSTARSFTVNTDVTPPTISATASSTTSTTATITWTTNEAATSTVDYGLTASYGTASSSSVATTTHSYTLTGLTPSTA